ncbi:primase C-terminal domain-containing protein [Carnobacterium maltaromaticum]|uniref:primase C-terminal domain-containing protein n=1 Tax=Carnobacterium maltaromaticum TaxID=2751 RepID=UPI00295E97C7|nr:primase C-terminal domain-containing protein [Carnobacterium maltaromaticum]
MQTIAEPNTAAIKIDPIKVQELILNGGLKRYKVKNSKYNSLNFQEDKNKKGAIFGFRTKENMQAARGIVLTSLEALEENRDQFTHWTPNIFSYGGYTDETRLYVKGHKEYNLSQINCFVVDIDFKSAYERVSVNEIIENTFKAGFYYVPTLVLKTTKGYHFYYSLKEPSFVSSANNYKSLRTARAISRSIKLAFAEKMNCVDVGCNNFGIFRTPNSDNIVSFNPEFQYYFDDLREWSMYYAKNCVEENNIAAVAEGKNDVRVKKYGKQINAAWFKVLINANEIDCGAGQDLGRNNAVLTMSLACYSSGLTFQEALNMMEEFNINLTSPLDYMELERTVINAYSGEYKGAHKDHINALIHKWVKSDHMKELKTKTNGKVHRSLWYKHKKARTERQRVHKYEWQKDLFDWINKQVTPDKMVIETTYAAIQEGIGIPKSTLKELLKDLEERGELFTETTRGRASRTYLTTRAMLIQSIYHNKKERAEKLVLALCELIPKCRSVVANFLKDASEQPARAMQMELSGLDTS